MELPEKTCLGLIDGHETAFEQKDRSLEPEGLLMRASAAFLVPAHSWGEHIQALASAYADARFGESKAIGPILPKVPSMLRPAVSHAVLRHHYASGKRPGPLRKRFAIMRAMASGKV